MRGSPERAIFSMTSGVPSPRVMNGYHVVISRSMRQCLDLLHLHEVALIPRAMAAPMEVSETAVSARLVGAVAVEYHIVSLGV